MKQTNNQQLPDDEKSSSFEAVRQFLIAGEKLIEGGNISCFFIEETRTSNAIINIKCVHHIPSYILDYKIFKSYNLINPIWSAYKKLIWDKKKEELIIEINEYKEIRLKRK